MIDGRGRQGLCRPLRELVSRRITVLSSITSMALSFTGVVISHSVASRGYRYPDAVLTVVETIEESFIGDSIKTYDK